LSGRLIIFCSLTLLMPCAGCLNEAPAELGVWSEFLPLGEVRTQVPALVEFGADLYLAVRPDDLNDDFWRRLADLQAAGVDVRLWPQLPEQGVWLNEENIAAFAGFCRQLLERAARHDVPVGWLIFDLEPAFAYAEALRTAAALDDSETLLGLLRAHLDAAAFAQASAKLRELVAELHACEVKVMAVTLPWTIDDLADGDSDLQDLFDTPLANVPWDQVCVMAYRPALSDLFGVPLSPGCVASYAAVIRSTFGPQSQIAIGNISDVGLLVAPGYVNPADAAADIAAVRTAGLDSVSLFSLDGMVREGGARRWLQAATAPTPTVVFLDPLTKVLRTVLARSDQLIDGFRPG
jgi:hypothetical protein